MSPLPAREITAMQTILAGMANAALKAINATGAPGPRGEQTTGALLWSGTALGYLAREARDAAIDGRQAVRNSDTFTITDAAGAALAEVAGPRWKGSIVTIEDRRVTPFVTTTWRVDDLVREANGLMDSITLALADPA